jgi:non-specific serine/threonine protein kinase
MTFPFMLRRTKELVATELPPKVESITYCEMDKPQELLYHSVRDGYRSSIMQSIEKDGLNKSRLKVLEGLMKLREICCHPVLIEEQYNGSSGKFDVWKGMLEEILAEGHKVLVFSQFVKMLRVLSSHCDTIGIDYEYLDGQTRDREERVRRFQEDGSVKLFLISLKAGGTGLNLTSADYVIHYDPWWNPAVEEQATDRTHRIGQMNNVFSYKLITRDSVEEKILQLQEKKRALVESVITSDTGFLKSLSKKDIESLFS